MRHEPVEYHPRQIHRLDRLLDRVGDVGHRVAEHLFASIRNGRRSLSSTVRVDIEQNVMPSSANKCVVSTPRSLGLPALSTAVRIIAPARRRQHAVVDPSNENARKRFRADHQAILELPG